MSQVILFECLRRKRPRVESADDEATSSSLPTTSDLEAHLDEVCSSTSSSSNAVDDKLVLVALIGLQMKFHQH